MMIRQSGSTFEFEINGGSRIVVLNEPSNERKHAKVELIEKIIDEMRFEKLNTPWLLSGVAVDGWVLNIWNATYVRISKKTLLDIRDLPAEKRPPEITTIDQLEDPKMSKIINTAATSKSFGI